jgi:uncharacterized protein YkwD
MKQLKLLTLFALWLLFAAIPKQIFALGGVPAAAQDTETPTPTETDSETAADTAVDMANRVNQHREEMGLPPYHYDTSLAAASQRVADTMAATEFISHYDDTGANPALRAEQAGYTAHVTEIIYGGFGGADAAWKWWIDNDLHYGLLLSEDYVEFGVARAVGEQSGRIYWAIMFGAGDGRYREDALLTDDAISDSEAKRPVSTATSPATAVSPTSAPTSSPVPTATAAEIALAESGDDAPPPHQDAVDHNLDDTSSAANGGVALENNSLEENRWLIIAAAVTIVLSIALFYFPRLGLSHK